MGLSKDDIDVTKETQRPEINKRTQKRRLRRKKLQAAKEETINTNIQSDVNKNIAHTHLTTDTCSKSVSGKPVTHSNQSNKKESGKNQKFTCPISDKLPQSNESALLDNQKDSKNSPVNNLNSNTNNQKPKSENKASQPKNSGAKVTNKCKCESNKKQKSKLKNLTVTEQHKKQTSITIQTEDQKIIQENPVLSINQQTKYKNIKLTANQEAKSEKSPLIQNREVKSEKSTSFENQKVEKKLSLTNNQKNKAEKQGVIKNHETKLNENLQTKSHVGVSKTQENINIISVIDKKNVQNSINTLLNKKFNTGPDGIPVVSINDYIPGIEYNISVVKQKSKGNKSDIKPCKNSDLLNQESLTQKRKLTETSANKIMGKPHDSKELQKQQEGKNNDLKPDDTPVNDSVAKSREDVKAAREAKKLAKQKAKKKNDESGDSTAIDKDEPKASKASETKVNIKKVESKATAPESKSKTKESPELSAEVKVETQNLKTEIKPKVDGTVGTTEKAEDGGKSKAELKAERRAKQEAQRALKQAAAQAKVAKPATKPETKDESVRAKEEKPVKAKSVEKTKPKAQSVQRVGWFWNHLNTENDKASLQNIPINSNLHPAVVKLGVQLASHVVSGSNARCIALLDALKKMVRDYSLPARTEFGRGLEAQLAASADFLAAMRAPTAAETNALKHFRRHLTLLPNNVDEFDAKKKLQEEIDRYIREQIDMAGEAISIIMRNKICDGDHILTYGCSSLIERVLCEAWAAGVRFRATVAGSRAHAGGREMLRRLLARQLPAAYVDISALGYVMTHVSKVVLGAGSLLANGAVVGAAGGAALALVARARNVPVLVACETHKFSDALHTDAFLYDEIGDPDDLIDKTDENSPLKDWRSNPNLNLLNLTYDVTPPSLITAVVTELGILPCTSAPVVLRFKLSEYGI